jgi:hypothetical protein
MNSEKLKFDTTEISMDYLETFLEPFGCIEHSLGATDLHSGSYASVFDLLL